MRGGTELATLILVELAEPLKNCSHTMRSFDAPCLIVYYLSAHLRRHEDVYHTMEGLFNGPRSVDLQQEAERLPGERTRQQGRGGKVHRLQPRLACQWTAPRQLNTSLARTKAAPRCTGLWGG